MKKPAKKVKKAVKRASNGNNLMHRIVASLSEPMRRNEIARKIKLDPATVKEALDACKLAELVRQLGKRGPNVRYERLEE